ncbi:MAG: carboxypeptidase-like regulatory domain-containing protein [Bryobacteraceae bacterium]
MASLCVLAAPVFAQQSLGSLAGKVTDPQGASVPSAAVVLTHTETNRATRLSTNDTGYFEGTLLNPGTYTVTVEAQGFKKHQQQGITVSVASRVDVDIQLQIGQAAETVQVSAEAPLLETTSASGGRIIDQRQIMQLPFSDMNPFALATLAPGMQWTGQPEYRRAFDNGGTSSFNTAGGVGSNEYTIDGAPVTGTGRRVGFVPPSDAVEEFKLETANFDASAGFTSGATINVMTKPGTNKYHGSLYDQHWQQRWNATPHFTRLAFEDQVRRGSLSPNSQRQAPGRSNNFGGTAGGPVRIPKLYNGTDKLFFFFSYNGIYQSKAETTDAINRTVPKMAWRQGDFSDLLAIDATRYTVYDPRSARLDNGRVVRTPFPGNRGVPVLNPAYKSYEPFYPKPNDVPGLVSPEGTNNYYALAMPKDERFNSIVNRVDYNIAEKHRIFGRWYWNHRLANEYDWTYETKRGLHANGLTRINKGGGGEYIWTPNSTSVLNIGASWTRFNEGNVRTVQNQYKPSDVGLPKYIDDRADRFASLPRMGISGVESVSDSYPAIGTRGTTGDLKVQFSNIRGNHSLRYGWQERRYWRTAEGPGNSSGLFAFDNSFMRQADNTTTASNLGLGWAAFMMGLPSGISIDSNDTAYWSTRYRSFYVQDDVRVSNRLRLNLGLRYERGGGATERYNRGLAGGFDFGYRPPFADAVEAAYARSPLTELPASQFKVLGGSNYLGQPDKTFSNGHHTFLPKAGAVYQINNKTVVRGGIAWYQDVLQVNNSTPSQIGYSQPTSTTMSNDRGLTFCCGLGDVAGLSASRNPMTDPFPVRAATNTRFDAPYGNTLGQNVQQGRGYSFLPRTFRPADQTRWRIGVQREIARDVVVEASYNGARSSVEVTQSVSYLPQQYWATGNVRRQDVDDALQATVPNPFAIGNLTGLRSSNPTIYNYLSTIGFFTSGTIRKQQLLRAFPNINGLSGLRQGVDFKDSRGINMYHDMQLLLEKRFARSFASSVMYTYAYGRESDFYYNEFDSAPSSRPQDALRPHRFVWTMIWEMPFGKGKRFVNSGPAQHLLGGWQLSWVYQYQNGAPTGWGNRFYYGDLANIASALNHDGANSSDIHKWFEPVRYTGSGAVPQGFTGFEGRSAQQPGAFHVRVFPTRLTDIREDGIRNWDVKLKRTFRIKEGLRTSFDVDLLNATNHTNFSGPQTDPTNTNFGRVTSQRGLSRVIQLNLRVDF